MDEIGTLAMPSLAELREAWPTLRDRIAKIAADCGEQWLPEDVFHKILVGEATLWATEDHGCFVVLQVHATPYERHLLVWIASEETEAHAADYVPQIQAIGASMDCSRVVFESPRRWDRALPGLTVRYLYSFET